MGLKDVFKDMKRNVKSIDSTIDRTDQELDHFAAVLDNADELIDKMKGTISNSDQLMSKLETLLDHSFSLMQRVESMVISNDKFAILFQSFLMTILLLSMWLSQIVYVSMFGDGIGVLSFFGAVAIRFSQAILFLMVFRLIVECCRYILFQKLEFKETEKKTIVNGSEEIVTTTYELVPSLSPTVCAADATASVATNAAASTASMASLPSINSQSSNSMMQNEIQVVPPLPEEAVSVIPSQQLTPRESFVEDCTTRRNGLANVNAAGNSVISPNKEQVVDSRRSSVSSSLSIPESVKMSKDFAIPNEPNTTMLDRGVKENGPSVFSISFIKHNTQE